MTEYNIFCYSKQFNDENSFQQKSFRVFNTILSKEAYNDTQQKINSILVGKLIGSWNNITKGQWNKLFDLAIKITGYNFKEGFEFISGLNLDFEKKECK